MKNMQELTVNELDNVNGGSFEENNELIKAMINDKAMSRLVDIFDLAQLAGFEKMGKDHLLRKILKKVYNVDVDIYTGIGNMYHHNNIGVSHDYVLNLIKNSHHA